MSRTWVGKQRSSYHLKLQLCDGAFRTAAAESERLRDARLAAEAELSEAIEAATTAVRATELENTRRSENAGLGEIGDFGGRLGSTPRYWRLLAEQRLAEARVAEARRQADSLAAAEAMTLSELPRLESEIEAVRRDLKALDSHYAMLLVDIAAIIAGPGYPWAAEAWRADLSVSPDGSNRPMAHRRQLLAAWGLIFSTAPRMRLRKLLWNATGSARRLARWLLYYDPATGIVLGACHIVLVELLREPAGFGFAVLYATAAILLFVEVVRRLRRKYNKSV